MFLKFLVILMGQGDESKIFLPPFYENTPFMVKIVGVQMCSVPEVCGNLQSVMQWLPQRLNSLLCCFLRLRKFWRQQEP